MDFKELMEYVGDEKELCETARDKIQEGTEEVQYSGRDGRADKEDRK